MRRINNKIIMGLIFVLLFAISSCNNSSEHSKGQASWARSFYSLNQLSTDSDIDMIAIGTIDRVVEVTNFSPIPWHPDYMTKFAFTVDTILKGEYIKEIVVPQLGAPDKPGSDVGEDPLFKIGEKYVLFLSKVVYSDTYHPAGEELYPNTYNYPGPWGRYIISNNKIYSLNNITTYSGTYYEPGLDFNGVPLSTFMREIDSALQSQ